MSNRDSFWVISTILLGSRIRAVVIILVLNHYVPSCNLAFFRLGLRSVPGNNSSRLFVYSVTIFDDPSPRLCEAYL